MREWSLPEHGAANGISTCIKGKFGWDFVNSPDRLTTPLIREGDKFREASWEEVFGAVTEEACRVLACEVVGLLRFEPDGAATLVAQSDTPWDPPPVGTRLALDGENVLTEVVRTRRAARVDDWEGATGAVAAMASGLGVRSAVATPVVVEGHLWGAVIAATSQSVPLPTEMESRIAQFTELVATAIANAAARGELSRLAEEQAALRRVAVLVAQQPSPDEVFTAVTGHTLTGDEDQQGGKLSDVRAQRRTARRLG